MHFLGCLLFLFLGFVFIIIAFFGNILRLFFNMRKTTKKFKEAAHNAQKEQNGQQEFTQTSHGGGTHHHKRQEGEKIFPKNEGEYIDFEEIKD